MQDPQKATQTTISTIQLQTISYNSLKIGTLLGHGGYGDVYKATWHGTEVAIKELHLKTLSKTLQDEFNHESQIMAQCQFPHIIGLYGICDEIGHKGFVMEYMPKGSLRAVLEDKSEEISWDIRWSIAIDIGKGLSYLHDKDILHRDLKSLNILLTADYHAKICDFGLSKIKLETSSSNTKSNKGTVRWRAPESFKRGYKATSSADIYSYGMVLWEIAARELPFADAQDELTVISWIKDGEKETIPTDCPKAYGKVIEETWQEAEKRPTAEKIVTNLSKAKPEPTLKISEKSLKSEKIYAQKPWHFDPATERKASQDSTEPYQILEATEKDKQKVVSFYQHHPMQGYEVGSVKVIYNRDFNQEFELRIKKLQQKNNNPGFAPKWNQENNTQWRAETHQKFENLAKPYQDPEYPAVKILPLWHGTKRGILDSIFRTGYANLATTDSGFFGKGLYGAHEAEYSYRVYGPGANPTDGVLILNWVASFSAYPVIDGDMNKLTGKGNHQNYDAHFAPVVPKDPNNKNEVNYFPCKPNQKNTYTELVTFESASCLPRYLIELQSNKPQTNKLNLFQPQPTKNITTTNTTSTTSTTSTTTTISTKNNSNIFFKPPQIIPQELSAQKDLAALLKWVTEGHLLEVEKLLQKNPQLVFMTGTVKDLSDRTFKDITVFQYAAWALDIEMWDLILKYLDNQSAGEQLTDLETNHKKYSNYGAHYDISLYTTKLNEYIKNYSSWNSEQCRQQWQKKVGGAQRQFPAWLVYAMCEEGENVAWVKKDMKNIKITRQYEKEHLKWWFEHEYNGGKLGAKWGASRGDGIRMGIVIIIVRAYDGVPFVQVERECTHDCEVGQSVKPTRNEALNSLKTRLENKPVIHNNSSMSMKSQIQNQKIEIKQPEKINSSIQKSQIEQLTMFNSNQLSKPKSEAIIPTFLQVPTDQQTQKDLDILLKYVTEGHLIEAEKLLKKNKNLAYLTGTVTDLSGRTFKDITVFQYAAWALDIEMWDLTLKYLDNQSAGEQLTDLEINHKKYSNYGAHYDISLYTTKLDEYSKNYSKWGGNKCQQHWQKEVGGAQRQFPAWLVYAFCEEGENVAWVKKDIKNMRVTRQYDKGHLNWWFEKVYNGGKLGDCWGAIRGGGCRAFDRHIEFGRHDHEVGQSVKPTRNEALNSLKIQLSSNNITLKKF